MLKFENVAKVGETIRSYDFKPMVDCEDAFVEGRVIDINDENGYKAFVIECTKDSMGSRVGLTIYVPMETCLFEHDGRIVNLSV